MTRLIARLARTDSIRVYWPKFLHNYAEPKTDTPSTLPRYINKYFWNDGDYSTPPEIPPLKYFTFIS